MKKERDTLFQEKIRNAEVRVQRIKGAAFEEAASYCNELATLIESKVLEHCTLEENFENVGVILKRENRA